MFKKIYGALALHPAAHPEPLNHPWISMCWLRALSLLVTDIQINESFRGSWEFHVMSAY